MKPQDMLELHDPDHGGIGDCLRASVATLLGLDAREVPHFVKVGIERSGDFYDEAGVWWDTLLDFLDEQGMRLTARIPEDHPYLASGLSPRGTQHVVVFDGDGTMFDPHPSRDGLLDVTWRVAIVPVQ